LDAAILTAFYCDAFIVWLMQRFAIIGWPGDYERCCLPIW